MQPSEYSTWLQGGVVSGVIAAIWGLLKIRRKVSIDNTGIAQDKAAQAHAKQITTLDAAIIKERDDALKEKAEAWEAYNDLVASEAGLRTSNEFLTRENVKLTNRVNRLEKRLGISFETDIGGSPS